jgi:DNA primase
MIDQSPKYLNSKESFIFKKGEVLYGLNFSENSIIKESSALVVEGFMDVVALYEHGITNVVGCMGITLSETCISRLNELSSEIVLGLDSDDAGIKASQRIGSNMLSLGIVPYTLSYLPYKDADDFLKNEPQGSMKLKKLINSSKTLLDIELEKLVELNKEKSIEQKSRCLKQIYLILSPLRMSISATERIILYSELLGLKTDPKFILENYQKGLSQVE